MQGLLERFKRKNNKRTDKVKTPDIKFSSGIYGGCGSSSQPVEETTESSTTVVMGIGAGGSHQPPP